MSLATGEIHRSLGMIHSGIRFIHASQYRSILYDKNDSTVLQDYL